MTDEEITEVRIPIFGDLIGNITVDGEIPKPHIVDMTEIILKAIKTSETTDQVIERIYNVESEGFKVASVVLGWKTYEKLCCELLVCNIRRYEHNDFSVSPLLEKFAGFPLIVLPNVENLISAVPEPKDAFCYREKFTDEAKIVPLAVCCKIQGVMEGTIDADVIVDEKKHTEDCVRIEIEHLRKHFVGHELHRSGKTIDKRIGEVWKAIEDSHERDKPKGKWSIKKDPVKREWVVIDFGDGDFISIQQYYDFARNYELAEKIIKKHYGEGKE